MAAGVDEVRLRLQRAALELFQERGYDRTTAAEIAARAGVTERTFFRKYPDKREVLFDGEAVLGLAFTEAIAAAPAELDPLGTLLHAFDAAVPLLEANRPFSEPWYAVVRSTPALHERELAKGMALVSLIAAALRARGVADLTANLAARIGMDALTLATTAWLDDPQPTLGERLKATWSELQILLAPAAG